MITLLLLLVFPLVWPFVAKIIWKHELTGYEHLINIAVGVLVVVLGFALSAYQSAGDYHVLNGQVTGKEINRVSCEHSYRCNCRESCSGSGSDRRCSTTCDTCYEHFNDFDHDLKTTLGNITIDRIDRQGVRVPPRYESAKVGDPVAMTQFYINYIKAAPDSLFNTAQNAILLERFKDKLPEYPLRVYDYHYIDRVIPVGVTVPGLAAWNMKLANALRELGPLKQANVVIVITNEVEANYANALAAKWLGGKKNDVVVVLGAPEFPKRQWARVVSWTDNQVFKIELRDELQAMDEFHADEVIAAIAKHIGSSFVRKPMKDFEYLKGAISPPTWLLVVLFLLSVGASVGCTLFLVNNNVRTPGPSRWR